MASFRKRDGSWEYRISYKALDGSYKQKSKRGFRTKADAQRAAMEAEREIINGFEVDKEISLYDYFLQWAKIHKKTQVTDITWDKYLYTASKIKYIFKQTKLTSVTSTIYQTFLNDLGANLAQATVERINGHIKQAVEMALHEGVIQKDFTKFSRIKASSQGIDLKTKFLQPDEYKKVLEISRNKIDVQSYAVIYLIAITGMRFGEALGITWDDVDFKNKLISVNKTWDYKQNTGFKDVKTASSTRDIPLSDKDLETLRKYKKSHPLKIDRRLFSKVSNNAINKTLRRIVGRNVHAHSLRHTYASFLISQHIELLSISKLLGHKDMNVTIKVYSHQLKNLEQESNEEIRFIFNNFG